MPPVNLSFYNMEVIYSLLTDPRWAWFNSVRDTEKYIAAVEWVKSIAEKHKGDIKAYKASSGRIGFRVTLK